VGFLKAMPEFGSRLTLHAADMTRPGAYDEIFNGVHTVFHPAEVFMSFAHGRDVGQASKDFGDRVSSRALNDHALRSSQYLVDSINKSPSVKRLVYTASIASVLPTGRTNFIERPFLDETREPGAEQAGKHSYAITKRTTEHLLAYQASVSNGSWSVVIVNPSDVVGPVLSPHQASETWQGKIAGIVQGIPATQEPGGRPWMLVDVRDVAEAQIRLAESTDVQSGERFIATSGDKILPEDIGPRIMELFPGYDCATTLAPGPSGKVVRNEPWWIRVHLSNGKVAGATGLKFHTFDETLHATVEALVQVGAVQPKKR